MRPPKYASAPLPPGSCPCIIDLWRKVEGWIGPIRFEGYNLRDNKDIQGGLETWPIHVRKVIILMSKKSNL